MTPITEAIILVTRCIFEIYISIVLLRFLFQCLRMNFSNPFAQFIVQATNKILVPLRNYIPGYAGVDLASIVLLLGLKMSELLLVTLFIQGSLPNLVGLGLWSIASLFDLTLDIFFYATLMIVVASWLNSNGSPMLALLVELVEPLMRKIKRFAPKLSVMGGGLDFSPMIVMVLIQVSKILLINPLIKMGQALAL